MKQRNTRQAEPTLPRDFVSLDDPRVEPFGRDLDELRQRIEAEVGADDLTRVRRLDRLSRGLEITGRVLLHFSFEPVGFVAGVGALWLHKQLQATEIGHTALHGAYDRIEGAGRFHAKRFRWDVPIDERAWHHSHNVEHHQYTNVAERDPDLRYGMVRLSPRVPFRAHHRRQLWSVVYTWLGLGFFMNLHATGLDRVIIDGDAGPQRADEPAGQTLSDRRHAALRKYAPYYLYNFVLFPALAGAGWWKVLLGNWMAETLRDVYSAASIFCGHVGADVRDWPADTRPKGRAQWYAMQVQSANDFRVPYVLSVLCGGLDYQIEHHLFPRLPPERLRQIAPEVEALCEKHGMPYRVASWPATLGKVFRRLRSLTAEFVAPAAGVAATREQADAA
ncbi:MAG: acyl-CoA desaturase [Deltaproteobacteria bacterium]|nr:acyl-CoA desaturase [Deltaproteobacteria bacterium]MBK8239940.1 acyl-CoA desaturase [Deltaproteobacteria bacterium]MBP7286852.1 acyl-CoA desaturase [Nannocystaceae bacterium]